MGMPRGLTGSVVVIVCAAVLIGVLGLAARDAPSAGRDPQMTPLALVPTRVPTPAATEPPDASH
jgi:hypothetical protein